MPALIFWKSVIKALVLPPTGLLLVILAGLWMARKGRRLGLALAGGGALALLALAVPLVAVALVKTLDPPAPFDGRTAGAGAIVIVGGGARRMAPEYGADTVNALSLERVRYGARVARTTGLPVLVTGGAPQGFSSEASLMQRALEEDFGVQVQWIESESLDTRENAMLSARILRSHGIHKAVLVTHAFDMKRAAAEFRDAGDRNCACRGRHTQSGTNRDPRLPAGNERSPAQLLRAL